MSEAFSNEAGSADINYTINISGVDFEHEGLLSKVFIPSDGETISLQIDISA